MNRLTLSFTSDVVGRELDVYDFSSLRLPEVAAETLAAGFSAVTAAYRSASRKQAWATVKKFSRFLKKSRDPWKRMQHRAVLRQFLDEMSVDLGASTAGSHYNFMGMIYRWLGQNGGSLTIVWLDVDSSPSGLIRADDPPRRNALTKDELERIHRSAKRDIDAIRARAEMTKKIIEGGRDVDMPIQDQVAIRRIKIGIESGVLGKKYQIRAGFINWKTPYRRLRGHLLPTAREYIAYVICILFETLANPIAAFQLPWDCLSDHPIDPLKKVLTWEKFRAGEQQALDVTTEGLYSVPRLVDEVISLTALIRPIAGAFKERLFLIPSAGAVTSPCDQGWHNALAEFISQYDLPDFNFVDLRGSGARLLAEAGFDIVSIQNKLQHAQASTTLGYLSQSRKAPDAKRRVAKFLGMVVNEASLIDQPYESATGLSCSDSTAGIAKGSRRGEPCLEYFQCAICPNSIVIIDSAKHVARMLAALRSLDEFKERANRSRHKRLRYETAFKETHDILNALIRRVGKEVLRKASVLAENIRCVTLE